MRLVRENNYITQNAFRSATSWLPPLWECFPFKQTRSCRRWRRVCRGVKETALLNESVEAGEFSAIGLWFCYKQVLNNDASVCLKAQICHRGSWCCSASEQAVVFKLPWYNEPPYHYLFVRECLLWYCLALTVNTMVIPDTHGSISCHYYRPWCLLVFSLSASCKLYEIQPFWFAAVR